MADVQLKLQASLDLAFLRNQLSTIGTQLGGPQPTVGIQFDRKKIVSEYRLLNRYFGNKTFRVSVETNIKRELEYAEKLHRKLLSLNAARPKNLASEAATGRPGGFISEAQFNAYLNRLTKAPLEAVRNAMQKAGVQMAGIGKGTVAELRQSILSGLPQVSEDVAKGLIQGLSPEMKENGRKGAKSLIDGFKDAAGIASPSRVFKQLGKFSAEGLTIGFLDGLKNFGGKAVAEIKKIAALMRLELASVGSMPMGVPMQRGGRGGGARQYFSPIGPLPEGSRDPWAWNQAAFRYEPRMTQPGQVRGAAVSAMRSRFPFAQAPSVMGAISSPQMLGVSRLALPAAGMSGAEDAKRALFAAREALARARSDERGARVMRELGIAATVSGRVPLGDPTPRLPAGNRGGALALRDAPAGGGRGFGGLNEFRRAIGTVNLPGTGIVREIGQEFGFAAKQVLLFGAAYKGLAFIQSFPAQVGNAVGQLQSFRNTLDAVSPTAQEAAASNEFILSIVDKYNIPLQSARDGFTKLYASMAPAGFNGEQVRDLFLGISQAAATFGMSADRVDRVNYAFAQMASKGQVMSEELKGQLGDVLPGAMAIFAEAAGFKGPEAITKFSQALEQGAYKGEAMKTLLTNVGVVMRQEFGPGAEGAARTFQGVINRLQNSTKLLYESFEPVAIGFLNSVVVPLTNGVKTIADGFNAFFTGTQAKTIGGGQFAQQLKDLQPALEGVSRNLTALATQFGQFAFIAGEVGKLLLQIAGNPVVGYLAKLYAIAMPINMALGVMRGLWAANALQLLVFNARIASGTSTLTAFRGMMAATGATAQVTAASIRTAGVTLRTFFATTGVGLVVAGISVLIERFMSMNQALEDARNKALGAAQAIRSMSQTEALQESRQAQAGLRLLNTLQARGPSYAGSEHVAMSKKEGEQLRALGIPATQTLGGYRMPLMNIEAHKQRLMTVNIAESNARLRQIEFEDRGAGQTTALAPITPTAEGAKPKRGRQMSMDDLVGGDIKRRMDLAMAAIGPDTQRRLGAAGDDNQAKRMINYFGQYRKIAVELSAVQETIAAVEGRRAALVANGVNVEEKLADLKTKQAELAYELEEVSIKQYNDAKEAYAEEQARRQAFIRDLEDIRIKNGQISPQQAKQIELARQYEDIIARYPFLTEQQKLELQSAIFYQQASLDPLSERIKELRKELDALTSTQEQVKMGAEAIGSSFAQSFKDAINGASTAQEALAAFFQRIADSFLDMAARMIQKWIEMQIIGLAQSLLPAVGGLTGGFSTKSAFSMAPGAIPAAGGITMPSFTPFATGGIVTGPTLGLIGEGRYNEAVVPLPDGRSIPVELSQMGGSSAPTVIVNVDAKGSEVQGNENNAAQLGRAISSAVQAEIVKQQRPGGLLTRQR